MHLFTRSVLQGLHDGLVEAGGMVPYPNDKIASVVFDEITSELGLPVVFESRPPKTAAVAMARALLGYGEKIAAAGYQTTPEVAYLAKQASLRDPAERAFIVARHYMQKAADEGSLVPTSPNTLAMAAQHDQIAATDLRNRPEGRYGVPIGTTDMPVPGMIGREMPAPGAPTTGASFKGANAFMDMVGRARGHLSDAGDKLRDAAVGAGNTLGYYGRQAGSYLNPSDAMAGLKDNATQALDAHNWLKSDPSTLTNLGHTHQSMQALRKEKAMEALHHLGRLGALGGLATAGVAAGYGGYRALSGEEGHETTASVKEALEPMSPEMLQALNELPPEYLADMKRVRQWQRTQEALANAPKLPNPAQNRDPISSVVNTAYARTAPPKVHPIPDSARSLDVGPAAETTLRGVGRGIVDELTSSPLSHFRNFEHRDLGGKLKSVGAVGAQLAGTGAAAYGLYRGGRALYDHLNQEKAAAEGDEAALAPILEACQEAGIHPTPELVAMLHQAIESGDSAPEEVAKQANAPLSSFSHAFTSNPLDTLQHLREAQRMVSSPGAKATAEQLAAAIRQRNIGAAALAAQLGTGAAAVGGIAAGVNALRGKEDAPGGGHYGHASDASWDAILKAAGEGSLVPTTPNTLANAAKHDQIAATDKKNRPEGKYQVPVGHSALSTEAGEVGAEKKVAEALYWENVKQAAAQWGQYLPVSMPVAMKRAAIEKVASLPEAQRELYVRSLHG